MSSNKIKTHSLTNPYQSITSNLTVSIERLNIPTNLPLTSKNSENTSVHEKKSSTSSALSESDSKNENPDTALVTSSSVPSTTGLAAWSFPAMDPPMEKNLFSALDEVLQSTPEGQKMLSEHLDTALADNKTPALFDSSADLSLHIDEDEGAHSDIQEPEAEPFEIDDQLIRESMRGGNLAAFAMAFTDHTYVERSSPTFVEAQADEESSSQHGEDHTSAMEEAEGESEEPEETPGRGRGRGRGRRGKAGPKRRSTRVQDITQRQEAQKIMEENQKKEQEDLENLRKLSYGDKIPVVKSYGMRATRPRRDDGRIDYTKLARGQGRVKVDGATESGGEGAEEEEVEGGTEEMDTQSQESDAAVESSSSPVKRPTTTRGRGKKAVALPLVGDSDNDSTHSPVRGRGGSVRGRGKRGGAPRGSRGRGRGRGQGHVLQPSVHGDDENTDTAASDSDTNTPTKDSMPAKHKKVSPKLRVVLKSRAPAESSEESSDSQAKTIKTSSEDDDVPLKQIMDREKEDEKKTGKKKSKSSPAKRIRGKLEDKRSGESSATSSSSDSEQEESGSEWSEEDDPDRLWCICNKPWNRRFMICCDSCETWFHGSCVNVTKKQGKEIQRTAQQWNCPKCTSEGKKGKRKTKADKSQKLDENESSADSDIEDEEKMATATTKEPKKEKPETPPVELIPDLSKLKKQVEERIEGKVDTVELLRQDSDEGHVRLKSEKVAESKREETKKSSSASNVKVENNGVEKNEVKAKKKKKEVKTEGKEDGDELAKTIEDIFGPDETPSDETKEEVNPETDDDEAMEEDDELEQKTASNKQKQQQLQKQLDKIKKKREKEKKAEKEQSKEEEAVLEEKKPAKKKDKVSSKNRCTFTECKKRRMADSVFCSNTCITKHAESSLALIRQERGKMFGASAQLGSVALERVVVFERSTNKILTGPAAPTESSLTQWLVQHPTYEVLQPGQKQPGHTLSFTKKKESKEKEDKMREIQQIKEKREKRERDGAERRAREAEAEAEKQRIKEEIFDATLDRRSRPDPRGHSQEGGRSYDRNQPHDGGPRNQSHDPRNQSHDPRHQSNDPRNQSNDPRNQSHDPRRQSIDLRNHPHDPRHQPRDPRHHNPDPRGGDRGEGDRRRDDGMRFGQGGPRAADSSGPDPLRISVRKALKEALDKRASDADDIMLSSIEIKKIALDLEGALFEYYGTSSSSNYRNKYRTILFYIKDPKNMGFFKRVLNGRPTAYKLVRLSADQIGSPAMSHWNENKAQNKDNTTSQQQESKVKQPYESAANFLSSIIDTTASHSKHLFDVNCKVCTGKQTDTSAESKPSGSSGQAPAKPLSVQTDQSGYPGPYGVGHYGAKSPSSPHVSAYPTAKVEVKHDVFGTTQQGFYKGSESSEKKTDAQKSGRRDPRLKQAAEPVKAMPMESDVDDIPAPVAEGPLVTKPSDLPPNGVWKGKMYVQDMCNMKCIAVAVSGPVDLVQHDFPETLSIVGRLSPPQVWDYVGKIRQSASRGVLVVSFQPTSEEIYTYDALFDYLKTRDRCGLVASFSSKIKDFYVIPLSSSSEVPQELMPFNGPGLDVHRPNLLLGVMIVHKPKRPAADKKPAVVSKPEPAPKTEVEKKQDSDMDIAIQKTLAELDSIKKSVESDNLASIPVPSQEPAKQQSAKPSIKSDHSQPTGSAVKKGDNKVEQEDNKPSPFFYGERKRSTSESELRIDEASEGPNSNVSTPTNATVEQARQLESSIIKTGPKLTFTVTRTNISSEEDLYDPTEPAQYAAQLNKPTSSPSQLHGAEANGAKNLDEQRRLLAELNAKVEAAKRAIEVRQKKDEPEETEKQSDALEQQIEATQPFGTKVETRSHEIVSTSVSNIARQRLVKKNKADAERQAAIQSTSALPPRLPPTFEQPLTSTSADEQSPVKSETTKATAPSAMPFVLPANLQNLLSGKAFENLKSIVATVAPKEVPSTENSTAKLAQMLPALAQTGILPSGAKSAQSAVPALEEGEIDSDDDEPDIDSTEIDTELEAAFDAKTSKQQRVLSPEDDKDGKGKHRRHKKKKRRHRRHDSGEKSRDSPDVTRETIGTDRKTPVERNLGPADMDLSEDDAASIENPRASPIKQILLPDFIPLPSQVQMPQTGGQNQTKQDKTHADPAVSSGLWPGVIPHLPTEKLPSASDSGSTKQLADLPGGLLPPPLPPFLSHLPHANQLSFPPPMPPRPPMPPSSMPPPPRFDTRGPPPGFRGQRPPMNMPPGPPPPRPSMDAHMRPPFDPRFDDPARHRPPLLGIRPEQILSGPVAMRPQDPRQQNRDFEERDRRLQDAPMNRRDPQAERDFHSQEPHPPFQGEKRPLLPLPVGQPPPIADDAGRPFPERGRDQGSRSKEEHSEGNRGSRSMHDHNERFHQDFDENRDEMGFRRDQNDRTGFHERQHEHGIEGRLENQHGRRRFEEFPPQDRDNNRREDRREREQAPNIGLLEDENQRNVAMGDNEVKDKRLSETKDEGRQSDESPDRFSRDRNLRGRGSRDRSQRLQPRRGRWERSTLRGRRSRSRDRGQSRRSRSRSDDRSSRRKSRSRSPSSRSRRRRSRDRRRSRSPKSRRKDRRSSSREKSKSKDESDKKKDVPKEEKSEADTQIQAPKQTEKPNENEKKEIEPPKTPSKWRAIGSLPEPDTPKEKKLEEERKAKDAKTSSETNSEPREENTSAEKSANEDMRTVENVKEGEKESKSQDEETASVDSRKDSKASSKRSRSRSPSSRESKDSRAKRKQRSKRSGSRDRRRSRSRSPERRRRSRERRRSRSAERRRDRDGRGYRRSRFEEQRGENDNERQDQSAENNLRKDVGQQDLGGKRFEQSQMVKPLLNESIDSQDSSLDSKHRDDKRAEGSRRKSRFDNEVQIPSDDDLLKRVISGVMDNLKEAQPILHLKQRPPEIIHTEGIPRPPPFEPRFAGIVQPLRPAPPGDMQMFRMERPPFPPNLGPHPRPPFALPDHLSRPPAEHKKGLLGDKPLEPPVPHQHGELPPRTQEANLGRGILGSPPRQMTPHFEESSGPPPHVERKTLLETPNLDIPPIEPEIRDRHGNIVQSLEERKRREMQEGGAKRRHEEDPFTEASHAENKVPRLLPFPPEHERFHHQDDSSDWRQRGDEQRPQIDRFHGRERPHPEEIFRDDERSETFGREPRFDNQRFSQSPPRRPDNQPFGDDRFHDRDPIGFDHDRGRPHDMDFHPPGPPHRRDDRGDHFLEPEPFFHEGHRNERLHFEADPNFRGKHGPPRRQRNERERQWEKKPNDRHFKRDRSRPDHGPPPQQETKVDKRPSRTSTPESSRHSSQGERIDEPQPDTHEEGDGTYIEEDMPYDEHEEYYGDESMEGDEEHKHRGPLLQTPPDFDEGPPPPHPPPMRGPRPPRMRGMGRPPRGGPRGHFMRGPPPFGPPRMRGPRPPRGAMRGGRMRGPAPRGFRGPRPPRF